jgi:hypothetical protein
MTEISERARRLRIHVVDWFGKSNTLPWPALEVLLQAALDAEAREIKLKLRNLRTAASRALEALESEDHEMCAEAWHELANQFDGVTEDDYTPWDKRNSRTE